MNHPEITVDVETAVRYYKNHLKNVLDYQKRHPERMREKNNEYNKRFENSNPKNTRKF